MVWDVKNAVVSIEGAREDYGVVIKDLQSLEVDQAATHQLRLSGRGAVPAAKTLDVTQPANDDRAPADTRIIAAQASGRAEPEQPAPIEYTAPPPLSGADVKHIKIVDFDKQPEGDRDSRKGMKIRYF